MILTHPLKWSDLKESVERFELENPDIWIEDVSRYGPCSGVKAELVCQDEDTDAIEASFSTIFDKKNNRIIIRHHF